MKIYTGTGDEGKTSLFSGERVAKHHRRVEAYGELDELGAVLGALAAALPENVRSVAEEIQRVQSELFLLGTWLASSPDAPILDRLNPLAEISSSWLEAAIDRMEALLPPLNAFILSGGHPAAAAHVARCVCRRAERRLVALLVGGESIASSDRPAARPDDDLAPAGQSPPEPLVYLNRLSDYLFVLARYINRLMGVSETVWQKR